MPQKHCCVKLAFIEPQDLQAQQSRCTHSLTSVSEVSSELDEDPGPRTSDATDPWIFRRPAGPGPGTNAHPGPGTNLALAVDLAFAAAGNALASAADLAFKANFAAAAASATLAFAAAGATSAFAAATLAFAAATLALNAADLAFAAATLAFAADLAFAAAGNALADTKRTLGLLDREGPLRRHGGGSPEDSSELDAGGSCGCGACNLAKNIWYKGSSSIAAARPASSWEFCPSKFFHFKSLTFPSL